MGQAVPHGVQRLGPRDRQFRERFISAVPGAHGQPHPLLEGGGHFLQEDVGPRLGHAVVDLLEST